MTDRILVVDDEESVRYSFKRFLNSSDYQIDTAKNGAEALSKFKDNSYDMIILDVRLPDKSGIEILKELKEIDPNLVVLIMTAFGDTETTIKATKSGAYDYILKPFDIPEMKKVIAGALEFSHLHHTNIKSKNPSVSDWNADTIIGNSQVMQEVYKLIGRVAASDVNVLLRGESGTGKELIARAIYQHSNRTDKPFLAVNCAAIPETLLESELFGYEKGAFTGANRRKTGKFELADEGIIFLDEIGDMTLTTQAKILRVLQEGSFERLGGEQTIKVNVRVVAATNRNLERAIEEGRFRDDLYYRIKVVTITLPPLRLRKNDIPALAEYFLEKHCKAEQKDGIKFSNNSMETLQQYHWPGNIREMENVIRRAIVLSKGSVIPDELITEEFKQASRTETKNDHIPQNVSKEQIEQFSGSLYEQIMSEAEKRLILQVLRETSGNQVRASKILGISRVMLHQRIEKYGIKNEVIIMKEE
ncbi:MAG: sigma-54-dependent transcriptional regulator [Calditrichaceae bacterium]